jgi:hypothetical protein
MSESNIETEASVQSSQLGNVDDGNLTNEMDIIYHNMDSTSNFYTFRQQRNGTLEDCIQRLARQIEAGCYDKVVSILGGSNNFTIIVETALSQAQLYEKDWPSCEKRS